MTTNPSPDDPIGGLDHASSAWFGDDFSRMTGAAPRAHLVHWVDLVETPTVRAIRARRAAIAEVIGAAATCDALDEAVRQFSTDTPAVHAHARRVAQTSAAVGLLMGITAREADDLTRAALLHDIGRLALPSSPARTGTPRPGVEARLARLRGLLGTEMLEATPALRPIAAIVAAVGERWDGSGFPAGRAGAAIPLAARIIAVADAHDEMTHPDPPADAWSDDDANVELVRRAGRDFDPDVVRAWLRAMENVSCF
jgi:response regulator RpfG family c-di-GMP phosphodiesterase